MIIGFILDNGNHRSALEIPRDRQRFALRCVHGRMALAFFFHRPLSSIFLPNGFPPFTHLNVTPLVHRSRTFSFSWACALPARGLSSALAPSWGPSSPMSRTLSGKSLQVCGRRRVCPFVCNGNCRPGIRLLHLLVHVANDGELS